ncbi:hypothetical protein [Paraburkholderia phenazinium]|uniref:hypothetical protein n=1 Tax=Paraburkholderia phenazinium TaxID=60549 RepID=UPI00158F4F46|nr:hypothetical protein [Paraburkholderia phenazinium]
MMGTNEVKSDNSRRDERSYSGLGMPEKIALISLFYGGWAMLILIGALVALVILPWLSLLVVTIGLGPICPQIVSQLARGPWLIAASLAGVTWFVIGRALNRLLNPIDDIGRDEQLDAAHLAQLVIERARRASRSN